jgi:hypothetical protein
MTKKDFEVKKVGEYWGITVNRLHATKESAEGDIDDFILAIEIKEKIRIFNEVPKNNSITLS